MIRWEAWLQRDAWTIFEAICLLLEADPATQEAYRPELNEGPFPGGVTWVDAETLVQCPEITHRQEFRNIDCLARTSHAVGKLKVYGDTAEWYERFVEPREWIEWAEERIELPIALRDLANPQSAPPVDYQDLANREAKRYREEHNGRRPTKGFIAKLLYKQGYGTSAETNERKIRKRW